jgi:phage/plasmid-associated DNA primase
MYYSYRIVYVYIFEYGCYFKVTPKDLSFIISTIFCTLSLPAKFVSNTYLNNIVKCAFVNHKISYLGDPHNHIQFNLLAVSNGILDVDTGRFTKTTFRPELFVVNYLSYPCSPDLSTPYFKSYLEHISQGIEEKKRFIMAILNVIIRGKPVLDLFVYIYGPGGVGKTLLTALLQALLEDFRIHATTLSAFNSDQFEAVNLEGKELIIIEDIENYTRYISQLTALSAKNSVRGRTIMMTGNSLLNIRDSSGAVLRRIRPFKMSKVPPVELEMLSKDKRWGWKGKLAPELPGILHQAACVPHEYIDQYIRNFHKVPALREGLEETADILNPLRLFVREALEEGEGAFLGLKPRGEKEVRDFAGRLMLYPTYLKFQYKRGLSQNCSHNTFSTLVMSACEDVGIKVEKIRKPSGIYIKGVMVKPNYYNPNIAAGGALNPN